MRKPSPRRHRSGSVTRMSSSAVHGTGTPHRRAAEAWLTDARRRPSARSTAMHSSRCCLPRRRAIARSSAVMRTPRRSRTHTPDVVRFWISECPYPAARASAVVKTPNRPSAAARSVGCTAEVSADVASTWPSGAQPVDDAGGSRRATVRAGMPGGFGGCTAASTAGRCGRRGISWPPGNTSAESAVTLAGKLSGPRASVVEALGEPDQHHHSTRRRERSPL